jgi:toxin CcdB
MAQFDFYPQRGGPGYWLDCQTELLDEIETRFVIPLIPLEFAPEPIRQLNPVFDLDGVPCALLAQQAGPIPRAELKQAAGSLSGFRYEIINALDFLISGI